MIAVPDVPPCDGAMYNFLLALRQRTMESAVASATASTTSGGSIPSLTDFGAIGDGVSGDDAAVAAAEASAHRYIWVPTGTFKLNSTPRSALTKHYFGAGIFKTSDGYTLPATFSYEDGQPAGLGLQGIAGWFDGDTTFGDAAWRVVGANARAYQIGQKYFEGRYYARNQWLDINSGGSGGNAFLRVGATAGATVIQLQTTPLTEWVGKQVGFLQQSAFTTGVTVPVETHTVTAVNVGAKQITIDAPLANNYPWNPALGQTPCILFNQHTNTTNEYIRVNANAAGDNYGSVMRLFVNYVPEPGQTHTYMAACGGQYGGDVTYGASGNRATGWESIYVDQGFQVGCVGQIDTFSRTIDTLVDGNGCHWLGQLLKSGGTRPIDATWVYAGLTRIVLDTAPASTIETTHLTANAGGTVITVASVNGARVGDRIDIADGFYTGTITAVNAGALQVTCTPAMGLINAGTIVKYLDGGAAISMAKGQRIVMGSSVQQAGRTGDSTGVFPPLYGNTFGDMLIESGNDGTSDFIALRFDRAAPNNARLRIRPTAVQVNTNFVASGAITTQGGLLVNGDGGMGGGYSTIILGATTYLRFNTTTNNVELYKNGVLVASW